MGALSSELYRTPPDAVEFRSVQMSLSSAGEFSIDAHDMGPAAKAAWGDDDYEFGLKLTPDATRAFMMHLVSEKYAGHVHAVDEVRRDLERVGITFEGWSWA